GAAPETRPRGAEIAALGALALACAGLGLLWVNPVQAALPMRLPEGARLEIAASLTLLAAGRRAGLTLRGRGVAPEPRAADWLGRPARLGRSIVRPFDHMARLAARLDDAVLDALPRGAARRAMRVARGWHWFDKAGPNALPLG